MGMASVQQEWRALSDKLCVPGTPTLVYGARCRARFNLLAHLVRSRQDVEREFVVFVFVWWLPPLECVRALRADFDQDGDRRLDGTVLIAIENMNLASAA